jgi:hypothetical protein
MSDLHSWLVLDDRAPENHGVMVDNQGSYGMYLRGKTGAFTDANTLFLSPKEVAELLNVLNENVVPEPGPDTLTDDLADAIDELAILLRWGGSEEKKESAITRARELVDKLDAHAGAVRFERLEPLSDDF